jgi:hypothetical protein
MSPRPTSIEAELWAFIATGFCCDHFYTRLKLHKNNTFDATVRTCDGKCRHYTLPYRGTYKILKWIDGWTILATEYSNIDTGETYERTMIVHPKQNRLAVFHTVLEAIAAIENTAEALDDAHETGCRDWGDAFKGVRQRQDGKYIRLD